MAPPPIIEVSTKNAPAPLPVFSQAVKSNGFVFCSGNIGLDRDTWKLVDGGIKPQTEQALNNLKAILEAAGSGLDQIVKLNIFIKTFEDFAPLNDVYETFFGSPKPARTCVAVLDLPFGAAIEIECTATCE